MASILIMYRKIKCRMFSGTIHEGFAICLIEAPGSAFPLQVACDIILSVKYVGLPIYRTHVARRFTA